MVASLQELLSTAMSESGVLSTMTKLSSSNADKEALTVLSSQYRAISEEISSNKKRIREERWRGATNRCKELLDSAKVLCMMHFLRKEHRLRE